MNANNEANMVGRMVEYTVDGEIVIWGVAEYVTADGFVGIRGLSGRLDEAPVSMVAAY